MLTVAGQSAYNCIKIPSIGLQVRWLYGFGRKVLVEEGQEYLTISIIANEQQSVQQKAVKHNKQNNIEVWANTPDLFFKYTLKRELIKCM